MEKTLSWLKESWAMMLELESEINLMILAPFRELLVRAKNPNPRSRDL